ncbi:alpha amylase C-terminal domain-containing protein [Pediococcus siamensis]|uniref:alpha amylase C-terminal domain-containing protein n=1 Tax=Pediococcus siamensis TaxID=381829 RepID=UPI0039A2CC91
MRNLHFSKLRDFQDQRALDLIGFMQKKGYQDEQILQLLNQQDEMTARGPFQWQTDDKYMGFSNHHPWNWASHGQQSVEQAKGDVAGLLAFYQAVLKIKTLPLFAEGSYLLLDSAADVFAFEREYKGKKAFVVVNFSSATVRYRLPTLKVVHTLLANKANSLVDNVVTMEANGSIVIEEN